MVGDNYIVPKFYLIKLKFRCTSMVFNHNEASTNFPQSPSHHSIILNRPHQHSLEKKQIISSEYLLSSDDNIDFDDDVEIEVEEVLLNNSIDNNIGNNEQNHDSDTGMV
jgi:hypothetical protein